MADEKNTTEDDLVGALSAEILKKLKARVDCALMHPEPRRCDTCGAVATNRAVDIIRHMAGPYVRCSPVGTVKYGCDQHVATSETHDSFSR